MFGLGMGELLIIAIVALLALGPDKLPGAAKAIGKGIRDLKKQSRELQTTIERDTQIGDAVRDLKAAFRGDDTPPPRPPAHKPATPQTPPNATATGPATPTSGDPVPAHDNAVPARAPTGPVIAAAPGAVPARVGSAASDADAGPDDSPPRAVDPPDTAHG